MAAVVIGLETAGRPSGNAPVVGTILGSVLAGAAVYFGVVVWSGCRASTSSSSATSLALRPQAPHPHRLSPSRAGPAPPR